MLELIFHIIFLMNSRVFNLVNVILCCILIMSCEKDKAIQAFPEKFAGVGIELEKSGQYARIVSVIPSSPADQAGIKPDDILIAINNVNVADLTLAEIVDKIRGMPKTNVLLTIESTKDKSINVFSVVRKRSFLTDNGYIFE